MQGDKEVDCEQWSQKDGLCQKHRKLYPVASEGKAGKDCAEPSCKTRGSFTNHFFSKNPDTKDKYCVKHKHDDMVPVEPFFAAGSEEFGYFGSIKCLTAKEITPEYWNEMYDVFIDYYLDWYFGCVQNEKFVLGDNVNTRDEVKEFLDGVWAYNKQTFEQRPERMLSFICFCTPPDSDAVIVGFMFFRAYPDDPQECLKELQEQVKHEDSLEAVLQSDYKKALAIKNRELNQNPREKSEDAIASMISQFEANSLEADASIATKPVGPYSLMVCNQVARLRKPPACGDIQVTEQMVNDELLMALGSVRRARPNLLALVGRRFATFEESEFPPKFLVQAEENRRGKDGKYVILVHRYHEIKKRAHKSAPDFLGDAGLGDITFDEDIGSL